VSPYLGLYIVLSPALISVFLFGVKILLNFNLKNIILTYRKEIFMEKNDPNSPDFEEFFSQIPKVL
jgi:hypothetical protein